ncbi:pseudaminic acid synthase [Legionella sp. km772]|uniref:pseudaminic acid synthase n=1 Tax=Legionella sp. km772 TaxID=2498111 RepID=UPI000F8DBD93|nr:pseudaminic acid synthase [Legionella sp. km772]RUR13999.1 pseudaminic acid synthase [Legionella sp. km772]
MNKFKQFSTTVTINGRTIGPGHPPYIIAELSGNHQGDINQALDLIDQAAKTGAEAIKIQTYRADTITLKHDGPEFLIKKGLWANRTLYDLYEEAHTPWEWHQALFERAHAHGITLFSSPFDDTAVDLLEDLNCPAYKIASYEITDIGLIKKVTSTGKPIIISTGLASLDEIEEAVETVFDNGGRELVVLHCISGYPTPIEDCNLNTITDLRQRFSFPIGLSDHTIDQTASVTAVALGASLIEKHFTLDKNSVDGAFSLYPDEFKELVFQAKRAYQALGKVDYSIKASEIDGRTFRRSLYVVQDIKQGETLSYENIRSVRPALGLHPRYLTKVIGAKAKRDLKYGTPLSQDDIISE